MNGNKIRTIDFVLDKEEEFPYVLFFRKSGVKVYNVHNQERWNGILFNLRYHHSFAFDGASLMKKDEGDYRLHVTYRRSKQS